ncbi:ABC transporter ATP-binding protein [Rhodovulum adriaticum]|uniref:Peptide/nickel transport system ATP-binding protein n=1 Tax=Rhodovulum adriaticum TaxID=35804 RepID=A0A4R2NZE4_RHOAD|nr:ABC transporter ATP-binding protein [Rhodovulum adriaticum]MBK1636761.1 methionine ABC transporter ATP-binding protein [Rhodovulum adriaticum]TCP27689.1 peptide/nickel transport system ATP-binding protein [Rhodovulum adriaticum]
MAMLEVQDLHVAFPRGKRDEVEALRGVNLHLEKGERLGVVGESGAGKSMLAFAILNLIADPGRVSGGRVMFHGENLLDLSERGIRGIRGNRISMIFQDPMVTLNPVLTIGTQMIETLKAHRKISDAEARKLCIERLKQVAIPSAESRMDAYPHELSGGLRQRVVIAIALLTDPELIIADEPTTALDVTIQAEIMALILKLCRENDVALILITHDLGVVAEVTERIMIMYAGLCVEEGRTQDIINAPRHPYTAGLLKALPQKAGRGQRLYQIPGSMPPITALPPGCAYNPRCEFAADRCRATIPPLAGGVACFHPLQEEEAAS